MSKKKRISQRIIRFLTASAKRQIYIDGFPKHRKRALRLVMASIRAQGDRP